MMRENHVRVMIARVMRVTIGHPAPHVRATNHEPSTSRPSAIVVGAGTRPLMRPGRRAKRAAAALPPPAAALDTPPIDMLHFDIGNAPSDAPPLSYGLAVHGGYLYYTDAARGVLARCSCGARAVLARCSRGARSTSSDQVRTRRSVVFVIFSTGRQFACLLFARLLACSPLCEEDRHCQRPRGADAHAVWRLWPPPSSRASYVCVLRVVLFSSFVILSF